MRKHNNISSIRDGGSIVPPGAISHRKQKIVIGQYREVFKDSSYYLESYRSPNRVLVNTFGEPVATVLRRLTLAVMRIKGDPEALAEKQVRTQQQSKKSS